MIYLDNSATTKQYPEVTETMVKFMDEDFGNPSSLYQLAVDAEKAIKGARLKVCSAMSKGSGRDFTGAGQLIFTSGGTEADNMAIFGAARSMKRYGNRIVSTQVEHPAVLECCKALEAEGFEVVHVGVDRNCRVDVNELEAAVNDSTVLVTMMHVNNEVGTVLPVDSVRDIIDRRESAALFHCDAVQSFGKIPMTAYADMVTVSGHKIHGPKGSGALWVAGNSGGRSINLPALILGGGQENGYRSGTENVPAIIGLGQAAEMAGKAGRNGISDIDELTRLRALLLKGLEENIPDIVINSPGEAGAEAGLCSPTILNVTFLGTRGEVLLHTLEKDGIYVSTGSACSAKKRGRSHVLTAMGLKDREIEGTLRFSLGRFNTREDIEITVCKVEEAVRRFRKLGSFR